MTTKAGFFDRLFQGRYEVDRGNWNSGHFENVRDKEQALGLAEAYYKQGYLFVSVTDRKTGEVIKRYNRNEDDDLDLRQKYPPKKGQDKCKHKKYVLRYIGTDIKKYCIECGQVANYDPNYSTMGDAVLWEKIVADLRKNAIKEKGVIK